MLFSIYANPSSVSQPGTSVNTTENVCAYDNTRIIRVVPIGLAPRDNDELEPRVIEEGAQRRCHFHFELSADERGRVGWVVVRWFVLDERENVSGGE